MANTVTLNSTGQPLVKSPLLTDLYQLSMMYAYWKAGKASERSVFELFFRKCPFRGEFAIFCGAGDIARYLSDFAFSDDDVEYVESVLQTKDASFLAFLRNLRLDDVTVYAVEEGRAVFPRTPLLRVEGPLMKCQLLETALLNMVNFASLVATNAARFRIAAGDQASLLEFGLRRAQGVDGGLSASRYSYAGGFDGTSNVLAGKLFGIPVRGTFAHAYVTSFADTDTMTPRARRAHAFREKIDGSGAHDGELLAFASFAESFPERFIALIDTYDTLHSGIINYAAVAAVQHEEGLPIGGVRIDSGDLAYLSRECRRLLIEYDTILGLEGVLSKATIVASNEIDVATLLALQQQGHSIDAFGIGTRLVTCSDQPAMGCVYKLVQLGDDPRMKLSEELSKETLPGVKMPFRLLGQAGGAIVDVLCRGDDADDRPQAKERFLCIHPSDPDRRIHAVPSVVQELLLPLWKDGEIVRETEDIHAVRRRVLADLAILRDDYKRTLNPTPYKVSLSAAMAEMYRKVRAKTARVAEIS